IVLTATSVKIQMNSTTAAVHETFQVPGQASPTVLDLPAGPYTHISVIGATLAIGGGLSLKGDFSFDQTATATRIGAANVSVDFAGNGIKEGTGGFVITPTGVAGILSGKASVAAGGFSLGGTIGIRFNTGSAAVDQEIEVNGQTIP